MVKRLIIPISIPNGFALFRRKSFEDMVKKSEQDTIVMQTSVSVGEPSKLTNADIRKINDFETRLADGKVKTYARAR